MANNKINEIFVSYSTLVGQTKHDVCIRRAPRDGGDRSERFYGVNREITASSLNRLHRVIQDIQIGAGNDGWTVKLGIYQQGMYIYLQR